MKRAALGVMLALLAVAGTAPAIRGEEGTPLVPPPQEEVQEPTAVAPIPEAPPAWPLRMAPDRAPASAELAEVLWALPDVHIILMRARELELSDRQVAELADLRLNTELKVVELNATREQACLKLEAALAAEKANFDAVRKLLHAMADAEAEICYLDIVASVKARDLLTAAQLERLEQAAAPPAWQVVPPAPRLPEPPIQ